MPKPKPPLVFSGRVRDGVLHLDKRALFTAALKAWDGRVTVTVAPEVGAPPRACQPLLSRRRAQLRRRSVRDQATPQTSCTS